MSSSLVIFEDIGRLEHTFKVLNVAIPCFDVRAIQLEDFEAEITL